MFNIDIYVTVEFFFHSKPIPINFIGSDRKLLAEWKDFNRTAAQATDKTFPTLFNYSLNF